MISNNMSITITNDSGENLIICTSNVNDKDMVVKGDPGLYDINELKQALVTLTEFIERGRK